jgi:hypothetical protein
LRNAWSCAIELRPVREAVLDTDTRAIEADATQSIASNETCGGIYDADATIGMPTNTATNGNHATQVAQVDTTMTFIEP